MIYSGMENKVRVFIKITHTKEMVDYLNGMNLKYYRIKVKYNALIKYGKMHVTWKGL